VRGLLRVLEDHGYAGQSMGHGSVSHGGTQSWDMDREGDDKMEDWESKEKGKSNIKSQRGDDVKAGTGIGAGNGEAEFWTWEGRRYPW